MIRYAVVGAGWISQESFLPGVAQSGNSTIAAIVTGDLAKGAKLAAFHNIPQVVSYADFDALLVSDAAAPRRRNAGSHLPSDRPFRRAGRLEPVWR